MAKKAKRKVHINNEVWTYTIGHGRIVIWGPDGKKYLTDYSEVSGWNWNDIERGTWKKYFSITPKLIKNYIEWKLLKKE